MEVKSLRMLGFPIAKDHSGSTKDHTLPSNTKAIGHIDQDTLRQMMVKNKQSRKKHAAVEVMISKKQYYRNQSEKGERFFP